MNEQEEFEFRLRFEREQAKPPAVAAKPADPRSWQQRAIQNLPFAIARGAGNIGATLLAPFDKIGDLAAQGGGSKFLGIPDRRGQQVPSASDARRTGMDDAVRSLGANPDDLSFQIPKLGTEIAGTLGAGPALAAGAARFIPNVAARAGPFINALRTGGATTGAAPVGATAKALDMGARMAGGGTTAMVAGGAIDQDQALDSGMIGAAFPLATKTAGIVGKGVGRAAGSAASNILGLSTGVGSEPIRQAFKAGATRNKAFVDNIKGDVPLTDVLDDAKAGLEAMRAAKSTQYRSGMIPIKGDKTALNFADVDAAIADAWNVSAFKGQVKNERGAAAVRQMQDAVEEWKKLDPAEFHTPEGMDALKQKIAGILEGIPYPERAARLAAGKVHAAVKSTINKQAPAYAKVMKDYQAASDQITEIERALSLGPGHKFAADTAMRKLQSLMRNNVQTNYGNRLTLANSLEQQGGVELLPSLSGQALNSWTPRSLSGQLGSGGAVLGSLMTGNLLPLTALPFQSPRLMGGAAYQMGRLGGQAKQAGHGLLGGSPATGQLANDALMEFLYRGVPVAAAGR